MNTVFRHTTWRLRAVRMKIQNIPLQTCKACVRCFTEVWESEWACIYLVVGSFLAMFCLIMGMLMFRDPCFQWEIRTRMCEDYRNGLIAGALCYDLCVEKSISLSHCVDQHGDIAVFKWEGLLIKARTSEGQGRSKPVENIIWEGMTVADFGNVLEQFFTNLLGNTEHSRLIERTLHYADFNRDKTITFGEIRSLWQLLQIQEYQMLYLFQENSVFPTLNGTCGNMYAMEAVYQQYLYDKEQSSFLDKIFPNRYRWGVPDFDKRFHIALGLLEYAFSVMEEENIRFYMCNFSPRNFGHTQYYEMKVSDIEGLISQSVLNQTLLSRECIQDKDCVYGEICQSSCNKETQRCAAISENYIPDVVKVCRILQDYVLYNIPTNLKDMVSPLVTNCIRIEKKSRTKDPNMVAVDENFAIDRLNKVLWDKLKYSEMKWLKRPTQKPARPL